MLPARFPVEDVTSSCRWRRGRHRSAFRRIVASYSAAAGRRAGEPSRPISASQGPGKRPIPVFSRARRRATLRAPSIVDAHPLPSHGSDWLPDDFRRWPKCEVPTGAENVCCWGQTGHTAGITKPTRLTRRRHAPHGHGFSGRLAHLPILGRPITSAQPLPGPCHRWARCNDQPSSGPDWHRLPA